MTIAAVRRELERHVGLQALGEPEEKLLWRARGGSTDLGRWEVDDPIAAGIERYLGSEHLREQMPEGLRVVLRTTSAGYGLQQLHEEVQTLAVVFDADGAVVKWMLGGRGIPVGDAVLRAILRGEIIDA